MLSLCVSLTGLNVGTSQFASVTEVDTNEFTLFGRVDRLAISEEDCKDVEQLTKREELSLRVVLALPKASSTGLVWTT